MPKQPFSWFDPRRVVRIYRGNLLHWRQNDGLYFVTFRLAKSVLHFHRERWLVGDFVIMPNHVHLLAVSINGYELEKVLYSVKRFSDRKINETVDRSGRFWQKEYYDRIVRDRAELYRIRKYISDNPGKAGVQPDGYMFRLAGWLNDVTESSQRILK